MHRVITKLESFLEITGPRLQQRANVLVPQQVHLLERFIIQMWRHSLMHSSDSLDRIRRKFHFAFALPRATRLVLGSDGLLMLFICEGGVWAGLHRILAHKENLVLQLAVVGSGFFQVEIFKLLHA